MLRYILTYLYLIHQRKNALKLYHIFVLNVYEYRMLRKYLIWWLPSTPLCRIHCTNIRFYLVCTAHSTQCVIIFPGVCVCAEESSLSLELVWLQLRASAWIWFQYFHSTRGPILLHIIILRSKREKKKTVRQYGFFFVSLLVRLIYLWCCHYSNPFMSLKAVLKNANIT